MKTLFSSLFLADCERWLDSHPDVNGIIDKDMFSGQYLVLDAG
jgi:hypothetical protein